MVGADLESLVATHQETDLLGLLVLHQADISGTALLPLVGLLDEAEKLGAPGGERKWREKNGPGEKKHVLKVKG